jgi:hypothetical protein
MFVVACYRTLERTARQHNTKELFRYRHEIVVQLGSKEELINLITDSLFAGLLDYAAIIR